MATNKSTIDLEYLAWKKALQDGYKNSLYLTLRNLCGYSKVEVATHGHMIKALESDTKRKLIVMPRGTFKSSIACVGYPIWLLLRNPNERILIDSELFNNSKNFLREIKQHLEKPLIQKIFGEFRTKTGLWNESEINISQKTAVYKEASISVGGVGTTRVGQHYSVIVADDYNSNKNSSTPEGRKKIIDHYRYNLSILDPEGTYVIVGTRYHEEDIIGWVIKNELGLDEFKDKNDLKRLEGEIYL